MDVVVDLARGGVGLDAWRTLTSLAVRVDGSEGPPTTGVEERLTELLAGVGVTRAESNGDALLPPAIVRDLATEAAREAGHPLEPSWDEEFAAMVAYAATRGWIEDDGAIRAHVEWRN